MYIANTSIALAAAQQWILGSLFITPAYFALDVFRFISDSTLNFDFFFCSEFIYCIVMNVSLLAQPFLDRGTPVLRVNIRGLKLGPEVFY
jgi:hypothetical protein